MHFYAFRFRRRLRDLAHGSKPRIGNDAGLIFADCASDPYTDGRRTLGGAQFEQPRATTSKFVKAEALYFQSVAIREKSLGKDDGLVAESLNNIATLYLEMGRRREAEPYLGGTFDAMRHL